MNRQQCEWAVDEIIRDLRDRRGLKQEWDHIDQDIQEEIRREWISLLRKAESYDLV